jgi:hypothetical protein
VFDRFGDDARLLDAFAEEAMKTRGDFTRHHWLKFSDSEPSIGLWFVAWSGTHREVQTERFGEYLPETSMRSTPWRESCAGRPLRRRRSKKPPGIVSACGWRSIAASTCFTATPSASVVMAVTSLSVRA